MAEGSGRSSTLETQVLDKSKSCSVVVCLFCSQRFDSNECSPMCILCLCVCVWVSMFVRCGCLCLSMFPSMLLPPTPPAALQPLLTLVTNPSEYCSAGLLQARFLSHVLLAFHRPARMAKATISSSFLATIWPFSRPGMLKAYSTKASTTFGASHRFPCTFTSNFFPTIHPVLDV